MKAALAGLALLCAAAPASADPFDDVLARHPGFSGSILIEKDGAILFDKAYGAGNRTSTSFHVGTLSMQYTAVTLLHLAETRKLSLDNTAMQFVPGAPSTTIRDLLAVAPDAPQAIADYELLARVAEAATGKSFADAEDAAAFGTVWMTGTALDDGSAGGSRIAQGGASPPDWRALAGAASVYTTTRDEMHWLDMFFDDRLVSADTPKAMFAGPAGYGWFHGDRAGHAAYWGMGSAPGFSSYVLRIPDVGLTVIVLGNTETQATAIGDALAVQALAGASP